MSDYSYPVPPPPIVPEGPGLTQLQRVIYTFSAPSKTFSDVKRNNSWWLPYLVTIFAGILLFFAITEKVTWKTAYENDMRNAPEFAKRMLEKQPAEARAAQDRIGPLQKEITWALSPLGLLLINVIGAGILVGTINFGLGGKATFGGVLAVEMYAGLVSWMVKFILETIALFVGAPPESFTIANLGGTNLGYYLDPQTTNRVLYTLATAIDPLVIWNLVLTSIGIAIVAGTKRSAGYTAVFGWWGLVTLLLLGLAAI